MWRHLVVAFLACSATLHTTQAQECEDSVIDLVFVVDGSGSICDNDPGGRFSDPNNPNRETCSNWELVKNFMVEFVQRLVIGPQGSRVGLVTFANNAKVEFDLLTWTTSADVVRELSNLPYPGGRTATRYGIGNATSFVLNTNGDRDDARNVMMLITDGIPNVPEGTGREEARDEANRAKASTAIFCVGVTKDIDEELLRDMSSPPQELDLNYFKSASFEELALIRDQVISQTCRTTPRPTSSACVNTVIDLAILVDGSGSICGDCGSCRTCANYDLVKTFVYGVIDELQVGPDQARISVTLFSERADILFDFNRYDNAQDMETAILNMDFPNGRTNTSGGLRTLRINVFNPNNGDRRDVQNVAIVLTDGVPTVEALATPDEARRLREDDNVKVVVIGVTENVNASILRSISSPPQIENQDWFVTQDFNSLITLVKQISEQACKPPATTPAPPAECRMPSDVIFILDSSGSIGDANFNRVKTYLKDVVSILGVGGNTRVGMIQFSDNVEEIFGLTQYSNYDDIHNAIDSVRYMRRTTNTAAAIEYAQNMFNRVGQRSGATRLAVILTDGGSNNKKLTFDAANKARATMQILAVGLGDWIDRYELQAIASDSYRNNLFFVDEYRELPNYVETLKAMLCNDVDECSGNPCRNGGQCLDMINSYYCVCRSPYGGPRCEYRCENRPQVAFILDSSGSIGKENFQTVVDFAKSVAMMLPLDDGARAAVETFSDDVQTYLNFNDPQGVVAVMDAMTIPYFVGRTTNTAEALRNLYQNIFNNADPNRPKYAILITDGRSNNAQETWMQAMAARDAGITLITIGVGGSVRFTELRAIASWPTATNVIQTSRFSDLTDRVNDVADLVCTPPDACSSGPCRNGGQCRALSSGYYCTCPQFFTGRHCERSCIGDADIVFILDRSGSIRQERFDDVKTFLVQVLNQFEVYNDKVRIALVIFSNDAEVVFHLNKYTAIQDIQEAIMRVTWNGGRTNIASALEITRRQVLVSGNGDRPDVQNFVFVFSDGGANIRAADTIPEAISLRVSGARILTMSVGTQIDLLEMIAIASTPSIKNVMSARRFNDMNNMIPDVVGATCNDENDCLDNRCSNGGTCVDGYGEYTCVCPSDRTGQNCDRQCGNSRYDVGMILDVSGSLYDVYALGMEFIRRIIYGLEFRFDRAKAALVLYSDEASVRFYLNTYSDKRSILQALSLKDIGGRTNTQAALLMALDDIFRRSNGDRDDASNILIIVTDGGSNIQENMTLRRAQDIKDRNTPIFVVAIGDSVNMNEVNGMASQANNVYVYRVFNSGDVVSQSNLMLDNICNRRFDNA